MDTGGPFGLEAGQLLTEEVDEEKDLSVNLQILSFLYFVTFLGRDKKFKNAFKRYAYTFAYMS
jgi:hypothetical protein